MRKYLKGLKRIMCLGLVGVMMFMMVPSDFGGSIEARAAVEENSSGKVTITMPKGEEFESHTYAVEIKLKRYKEDGSLVPETSPYNQPITINGVDTGNAQPGLVNSCMVISNNKEGYAPGETLEISKIPISGSVENTHTFINTELEILIICGALDKIIKIDGATAMTVDVEANVTVDGPYTIEENENFGDHFVKENHNFINQGGKYDYRYLVNHYNIISWSGDIEANHLVGAVLASGNAYRTIVAEGQKIFDKTLPTGDREYNSGAMVVSDYARGIFSYVHELTGTNNEPNFKMNYDFDNLSSLDDAPVLYTSEEKQKIFEFDKEGNVNNLLKYILPTGYLEFKKEMFRSPNMDGRGIIYANDDFIEFSEIENALTSMNTTSELVSKLDGNSDIVTLDIAAQGDDQAKLTVEAGKSYIIKNASTIELIDLILPEGYDFFGNPYPEPTIVSFEGAIRTSTIGGVSHYILPDMKINGEDVPTYKGENGEYNERGNKIVWHFPDLSTDSNTGDGRLTLGTRSPNIPGHILAPNVEIWNYEASGSGDFNWLGGNLNGSAMVKAFHGGEMEMHMFAFDGRGEVGIILRAEKTVDGKNGTDAGLAEGDYDFKLTLISGDKTGILNGATITATGTTDLSFTKPSFEADDTLTASVKADGSIEFPALSFSKVGEYVFHITEVIPAVEDKIDGIIYDQSTYKVTVKITSREDKSLASECTIVQIKDSNGNSTETPEDSIIFNNTTGTTYGTTFTKKDANNDSLALKGAEFTVTECNTNGDITTSAVSKTVTSNEQGVVNITGLEANKSYKVVETEAPDGYSKTDDYYIISVGANGEITVKLNGSGTNIDLDNWVVTNTKAEYTLPLTGGSGTLAFYLVGTSCIGLALIMGMRRKCEKRS